MNLGLNLSKVEGAHIVNSDDLAKLKKYSEDDNVPV